MKTSRTLTISAILFAAASSALSAAPAWADGERPPSSAQACSDAWHQSEASSSCSLRFVYFFPADFCKLGVDCRAADGGVNPDETQTRLPNVPLLKNCDGRLGFIC